MVQIVLIRPGATDFDSEHRIQGTLDIPLNDTGNGEAARLADELKSLGIEAVYSSDCQAALATATTIAAGLGIKVKRMRNMGNLDHGLWQGMLVGEVKRKYPKVYRQWQEQPASICPPEGETLGEAEERVQGAVLKILKKHRQDRRVALVVPEPLASVVRRQLAHTELGDLWHACDEHGHWELIDSEPQAAGRAP